MSCIDRKIEEIVSGFAGAFWGVADIARVAAEHPEAVAHFEGIERFCCAVVVAAPLPKGAFSDLKDAPTPLYMHHYRQLNYALDRLALRIAAFLEEAGHTACAVAASQYVALSPRPVGHLSHRVLGYYAGLGFIGRPTLLVTGRYGPRVRLVSVLTDAALDVTGPQRFDGCGDCRACIDACPVGAVSEDSHAFNWRACFEKLRSFRKIPFVGQDICGVCIAACPRSRITQAPAARNPQASGRGLPPS